MGRARNGFTLIEGWIRGRPAVFGTDRDLSRIFYGVPKLPVP